MHHIALKGSGGEIRWAYHRAATLGSWTLDGGRLTAELASVDAFKLSQQPLTFVVYRPKGIVWKWTMQDVQRDGSTLQASLVQED